MDRDGTYLWKVIALSNTVGFINTTLVLQKALNHQIQLITFIFSSDVEVLYWCMLPSVNIPFLLENSSSLDGHSV